LREQSTGSRVGAEVEIKRTVLLEENEDVLDIVLQQSEFLSMGENRCGVDATGVAGDFSA